jgi:hypothetical protein
MNGGWDYYVVSIYGSGNCSVLLLSAPLRLPVFAVKKIASIKDEQRYSVEECDANEAK